jgi:hypothetical protein
MAILSTKETIFLVCVVLHLSTKDLLVHYYKYSFSHSAFCLLFERFFLLNLCSFLQLYRNLSGSGGMNIRTLRHKQKQHYNHKKQTSLQMHCIASDIVFRKNDCVAYDHYLSVVVVVVVITAASAAAVSMRGQENERNSAVPNRAVTTATNSVAVARFNSYSY